MSLAIERLPLRRLAQALGFSLLTLAAPSLYSRGVDVLNNLPSFTSEKSTTAASKLLQFEQNAGDSRIDYRSAREQLVPLIPTLLRETALPDLSIDESEKKIFVMRTESEGPDLTKQSPTERARALLKALGTDYAGFENYPLGEFRTKLNNALFKPYANYWDGMVRFGWIDSEGRVLVLLDKLNTSLNEEAELLPAQDPPLSTNSTRQLRSALTRLVLEQATNNNWTMTNNRIARSLNRYAEKLADPRKASKDFSIDVSAGIFTFDLPSSSPAITTVQSNDPYEDLSLSNFKIKLSRENSAGTTDESQKSSRRLNDLVLDYLAASISVSNGLPYVVNAGELQDIQNLHKVLIQTGISESMLLDMFRRNDLEKFLLTVARKSENIPLNIQPSDDELMLEFMAPVFLSNGSSRKEIWKSLKPHYPQIEP